MAYSFGCNNRLPGQYVGDGNVFVEQGAYFPFLLGDDDPLEPIWILNDKIHYPLEVYFGN